MSTEDGSRRRVILGLGNPGPRYAETRHNVGFRVVAELARRRGVPLAAGECNALAASAPLGGSRGGDTVPSPLESPQGDTVSPPLESPRGDTVPGLELVAPQTYMNRSGFTARCLAERHDFEPGDFLVVYDEIHLPLGRLRLRRGGSPAGHRGMESVIESLGTDQVPRLRLGVAAEDGPPDGSELVDFVLEPFEDSEIENVEEMIRRAADACEAWASDGVEAAMQRYNG